MDIKSRINDMTDEMLDNLAKLVQYNSELGEAKPGMPFGEGPAAVLAEALTMAEGMGFETKNLDNYCGYAQMGEGEDIIGIAAHLDVVPAGEGWTSDPFKMEIRDGKAYGRGVMDDKGAVISSLYAMQIVREMGLPLNKRVRLIMGCNEETGSRCMEHYNEVEEPLTMGYTPDGYYPGIYGEKGGMALNITSKNTKIIAMNGGFVSNAVCNRCKTVVPDENNGGVIKEAIEASLKNTALKSFTVTSDNGTITIDAIGVSAHASTPLLGVNAAGETMAALAESGFTDDFVDFYNSHIGTKCDGEGCGLKLSDDYGELTFNNGIVKTEDGVISCNIDIRYPVTLTEAELRAACAPYLEDEKGKVEITRIGEPLFFPKDSDLVKALHGAYKTITGDEKSEPMVIGGGTYAKSLPGIIAFGPEFVDVDSHIHDADECLDIEEFKLQVEIYVEAIKNLLAV